MDGRRALELWEAVLGAGDPIGIAPYGTEAMHVLRAEKGFVIVGQDTDGTVTPARPRDGVDRAEGRLGLHRQAVAAADGHRRGPIGSSSSGSSSRRISSPKGAQLVEEDTGRIPMAMIGHVTSSYRSATLDRPIALAMVERGRDRTGQTVFAPLPEPHDRRGDRPAGLRRSGGSAP